MIVTVTGLPGNGKTLFALQYVKAWAERESRQVFYHGIKDLKLPWTRLDTKIEKIGGEEREVPQWWQAPKGSIVVIDEAQFAGFGTRQRGQMPEWAQKLETHRHLGIDLLMITQDPSLIDAHDRRLSERHFHLVRKWGKQKSTVHEFSPVRDTVAKPSGRKDSIKSSWKFPKEAYGWYTSAEQHTHKARVPLRVYVFYALPVLIAAIVWFTWTKYLDPTRKKTPDAAPGTAQAAQLALGGSVANGAGSKLTKSQFIDEHVPRVPGLAYTAPVYDDVTKPIVAPYPAACIASAARCSCFTQQGTRLETPASLCKSIAEGGFFVAWAQPEPRQAPPSSYPASVPAGSSGQAVVAGFGSTGAFGVPAESKLPPADPTVYAGRGKGLPALPAPRNGP